MLAAGPTLFGSHDILSNTYRKSLGRSDLNLRQKGKRSLFMPIQVQTFHKLKAPRFQDNLHRKAVSLLHLCSYPRYSFLSQTESTPGPDYGQKNYINKKFH